MKVVQINTTCGVGSTGKICVGISDIMCEHGIENYILYQSGNTPHPLAIKCAQNVPKLQSLKSRILGNYGFNSLITTRKIIKELEKINPDIVHLHNLHGHNCHLGMLMDYFRSKQTKLVWTFHDCWAFTAYCPHFIMANCNKWKTGCYSCIQKNTFSWFFDRSKWLFNKKKETFSHLDLTIVTPSKWLANLVKESFLSSYPVKVINNGIDLDVFRPTTSDFRARYRLSDDKFIILGVAFQWGIRKGIDAFLHLAKRLDKEKFKIVMIGTDDEIDKLLPENVISIHRTSNQKELAEIYTAADLFVNPTREDTFPTVNMEALACGTPILTFRTGGSIEILDEFTGKVVDCNDEESMYNSILEIERARMFTSDNCIARAKEFNETLKFNEYIELYLSE